MEKNKLSSGGKENSPSREAPSLDELRDQLETYKHAYESTAADRDRLAVELEKYKHAFETTAQDRDRIAAEHTELAAMLERMHIAQQGLAPRTKAALEIPIEGKKAVAKRGRSTIVPDLYCVGAPKSGTSFIYSILRKHPLVHVTEKDSGNLIELLIQGADKHLDTYFKRTAKGYKGQPVVCEFEVGYMTFAGGAAEISRSLNADARVLLCLRDPVSRAVSEYKMRVRQFGQDIGNFVETEDFHEAVGLEPARKSARVYQYLQYYAYAERGKYYSHFKEYVDLFGRENISVLIFEEEIENDIERTILRLFDFLSIRDDEALHVAFEKKNREYEVSRSPEEIQVMFHLADGSIMDDDTPTDQVLRTGVDLIEITSNIEQQLAMRLETPEKEVVEAVAGLRARHALELTLEERRAMFESYFATEVANLEDLLERDLSCWYGDYI